MKKFIFLFTIALLLPIMANGQAKKPTLMIFPADIWMNQNGYSETVETQGRSKLIPNYEKAFQNNRDINNVIAKIGELMTERGMNLESLQETMRQIEQVATEDEFIVSNESGASLAETAYDKLLNTAKSDIRIYLDWQVNSVGPKRSITYTLTGKDAYTGKQIANASGTGPSSFAAELPVLLEEAVLENMDQFISQLQMHFDDLLANGREIRVSVRVFDNGSGLDFESEYDATELSEVIENWMYDNTVNHRFSTVTSTENRIDFNQVRIPLYDERGRAMDAKRFVSGLRKYLAKAPFNIVSKDRTRGLGLGVVVLGEK